ncbi:MULTISPECIES: hypothetical protein [unclassified Variovorax]|jgi:hypothetical protein|uniref:hypothetical protein n=1 Tax=unclassified Variovorax TaxID=663243 RepID=UPI00076C253E|nr:MULTISPECIES: hypothetical protein [unclassified Variovorax]MBT9467315.1 hypothetical protein [Hydrogenophaga sp.]KWT97455.1 hypothetical protein APY03_1478 [Variovorax sp. WDL1]PNG50589.1 hypothetical protein CHC06_06213 [Variovorax sp. B2]PNG51458.1 hypothetical protein CHC07_06115 [Variovorax sp. B4]VTV17769.1 hypothetical protein WDL1P1_00648 [Variovorax sp. WDL1]
MSEMRPAKAYEVDLELIARVSNHKPVVAPTTTAPPTMPVHSTSAWKRKLLSL